MRPLPPPPPRLLTALYRANQGILTQKLALLRALDDKLGEIGASNVFYAPSSMMGTNGATIGQHVRHSSDHIERAIRAATASSCTCSSKDFKEMVDRTATINVVQPFSSTTAIYRISYDQRERGGLDESSLSSARQRIESLYQSLDSLISSTHKEDETKEEANDSLIHHLVLASFMLMSPSGDSSSSSCTNKEMDLPSTVARELGFAAHHAIHHLAMVKIMALHEKWLTEEDLPADFGRAPSTVMYDRQLR